MLLTMNAGNNAIKKMIGVVIKIKATKAMEISLKSSSVLRSDLDGCCSTCASRIAKSIIRLEAGAVAISRMKTDPATAADEIMSAATHEVVA